MTPLDSKAYFYECGDIPGVRLVIDRNGQPGPSGRMYPALRLMFEQGSGMWRSATLGFIRGDEETAALVTFLDDFCTAINRRVLLAQGVGQFDITKDGQIGPIDPTTLFEDDDE